jgi:hypothetical protein
MIAHTRSGKIIRKYNETGRVTLENGDTVSPPVAGYINGNDRIVPVVEVTVDNSTTTRTNQATVETVEADRVLRTVTISDISIEDTRAITFLTRRAFCLALAIANILPPDQAIEAAKGNWPTTFVNALAGLPDAEKIAAQIEWATAQNVQRNHPLIAMLAVEANISAAQVDTLFGIATA